MSDTGSGVTDNTPMPFNALMDTGMLWLINTSVFHPRGYAMAIHTDDEGNAIGWSILGDGTEPWVFKDDEENDQKFSRSVAFLTHPSIRKLYEFDQE